MLVNLAPRAKRQRPGSHLVQIVIPLFRVNLQLFQKMFGRVKSSQVLILTSSC